MTRDAPRPVIVWFRLDLRIRDNPALHWAAQTGAPILPVYVLDDETPGDWRIGGASRWWLHESLTALQSGLRSLGAVLVLRRGRAQDEIGALVRECGAAAVYANRVYEPFGRARDAAIARDLAKADVQFNTFNGSLLVEPGAVANAQGEAFRVYSAFWRAALPRVAHEPPLPAPGTVRPVSPPPCSDRLDDWALKPAKPDWAEEIATAWRPGEAAAHKALDAFLAGPADGYAGGRDRPDRESTSRLSPHLHWGEISPRTVLHAVRRHEAGRGGGLEKFVSEIGWREFSYHLLAAHPDLPEAALRPEFANFPWADDHTAFEAWSRGLTGYPIVDAGMRQLWRTGWMHNRVRMVVASFLVKHLLVPWQAGARWFWDTLVDADLASNSASWQWVAGCGADAAPFFRIFNPVLQGSKFDPEGAYVRRYVPELARLPAGLIHQPWTATAIALRAAGVRLGETYPGPIVDHGRARKRALAAFEALSGRTPRTPPSATHRQST